MPDFTKILLTSGDEYSNGTTVPGPTSYLIFRLTTRLTNTTTGRYVDPRDEIAYFTDEGTLSITLDATDDPTTDPAGAAYQVTPVIVGSADLEPIWIELPYDSPGGTAVLGLLDPGTTAPVVTYYALATALTTESTARVAGDATNATAITTEATSRASGDSTNAAAIAAEATTRATNDSAEATARIAGDAANAGLISAEATTARAAEGVNAAAITTEASTARAAESAEAATRGTADTTLTNNLASEVTNRTNADTTEATARGNADTAHAALTSTAHGGIAAPGGGLLPHKVGDYLAAPCLVGSTSRTNGNLYLSPLILTQAQTFDALAVQVVTTAGSAGAVVRLGIYASAANGRPGALVLDAGTAVATSTGVISITINQALAAGVYWLAAVTQGNPATPPTYTTNSGALPGVDSESTTQGFFSGLNGWQQTSVSGALPNPAVVTNSTFATIRVLARVSV